MDGGRNQAIETSERSEKRGCLNLVKLLLFCRLPSLQQPSLLTGPTSGQRWFRTRDCTSLHRCTFTLGNRTRCLQLWGWGPRSWRSRDGDDWIWSLVPDQLKRVSESWKCERGSPGRTTGIEVEACKQRDRRSASPPRTDLTQVPRLGPPQPASARSGFSPALGGSTRAA